jgi:hypothetical protein
MLIEEPIIDDFKVDRKGITPALPLILRLVPVGFYCSIGVTIILCALFFFQLRLAGVKRDGHKAQVETLKVDAQKARAERTALEAEIKKANNVENWVGSSRVIQPLVVGIARSMGPKSSILDLRLTRVPDNLAQLKLSIKMATASTKQLDATLEEITKHKYRAISPVQTLGHGELDYRATLVRQESTKAGEEAR